MPDRIARHALAFVIACLALRPALADEGGLDTAGFHAPDGYFAGSELNDTSALFNATRAAVLQGGWGALAFVHPPDFELAWQLFTREGALAPCVVTFPGAAFLPYDVELDREGRLLVTGAVSYGTGDLRLFVARFLFPNCTLDDTFDGDGYFTWDHTSDVWGTRFARMLFPTQIPGFFTERIVVAGYVDHGPAAADRWDFLLLRLRDNGSLDEDLGGSGALVLDFGGVSNRLADVLIDADNRILLAGLAGDPNQAAQDAMVARRLADGGVDSSFGFSGWRRFFQGAADRVDFVSSLARAPNGDLYLAGTATQQGSAHRLVVTRLSGVHGFELGSATWPTPAGSSWLLGAEVQGDWRLVLAGRTTALDGDWDIFTMARRIPGLELDPLYNDPSDFEPLSYVSLDLPGFADEFVAFGFAFDDGRPLIAGYATPDQTDVQPFVVRLENAYIFADGFESGDRSAW